jgi:glutamate synthase (NADPH) small chain
MPETTMKNRPRVAMAEQSPQARVHNFDEVPLGYAPAEARSEAARCLRCKKPRCVEGCPVRVDIPGFVGLVADGQFSHAARKIKETNCLPAICGRV